MYGEQLREHLERERVSVKELSRRLGSTTREQENARSSLYAIFRGREPRAELRQRIAEALGTTREAIEGADEEDEEEMLDALLARVADLTREVRSLQKRRAAA